MSPWLSSAPISPRPQVQTNDHPIPQDMTTPATWQNMNTCMHAHVFRCHITASLIPNVGCFSNTGYLGHTRLFGILDGLKH